MDNLKSTGTQGYREVIPNVVEVRVNNYTTTDTACDYNIDCETCPNAKNCGSYGEHTIVEDHTIKIINLTSYKFYNISVEGVTGVNINPNMDIGAIRGYNEKGEAVFTCQGFKTVARIENPEEYHFIVEVTQVAKALKTGLPNICVIDHQHRLRRIYRYGML